MSPLQFLTLVIAKIIRVKQFRFLCPHLLLDNRTELHQSVVTAVVSN